MSLTRSYRYKLLNAALFLLLSACTPSLNWRQVQLTASNGSSVKASLPCKPDQATRKQQLAGFQLELSMMGCVANETTFTLSHIPLDKPLEAPKVLAAWQTASVTNVGAKPVPLSAATVAGAGAWPAASNVSLLGAATQAHMLWFAKQTANGVTLYQAAVYGKQPNIDAVSTFFESLQVQ